jgi:hypothetical protein
MIKMRGKVTGLFTKRIADRMLREERQDDKLQSGRADLNHRPHGPKPYTYYAQKAVYTDCRFLTPCTRWMMDAVLTTVDYRFQLSTGSAVW